MNHICNITFQSKGLHALKRTNIDHNETVAKEEQSLGSYNKRKLSLLLIQAVT
jgi:hypothetical protein